MSVAIACKALLADGFTALLHPLGRSPTWLQTVAAIPPALSLIEVERGRLASR